MQNYQPTSGSAIELALEIKDALRDVPDFPKPGIVFKDLTSVLQQPQLCERILEELYTIYSGRGLNAIVAIESRGFLFGFSLAMKLGIPFVPVRKAGKLPCETHAYTYDLEYGSAVVEMHKDAIQPGWKVLIHDDLLATGGTANAAAELVRMNNGQVDGFNFIVELGFLKGRESLRRHSENTLTLAAYN